MRKLEDSVKKEILHITIGTLCLSAVMIGIVALFGKFSLSVLWGALIGSALAILNFIGLAFSVQKAVEGDEAKGKLRLRASYSLRMVLLFVIMIFIFNAEHINPYAALAPLLFPRLTIGLMNLAGYVKKKPKGSDDGGA